MSTLIPITQPRLSLIPPLNQPPRGAVATLRLLRERGYDVDRAVFHASWIHGLSPQQAEVLRRMLAVEPPKA